MISDATVRSVDMIVCGLERMTSRFSTLSFERMVKGIFVTRDRPFNCPVKCEMAIFFLVNRDFRSGREA